MAVHACVRDRVVNTVSPLIFGDNFDWRGDGFRIWKEECGGLDPVLVKALKESGITTLRYPGGSNASYFHWRETVGENRLPQIDAFSKEWPTRASAQGEKYDVHVGFEEFLSLCEQTGILPSIILNVGNGTPEEAADWICWCLDRGVRLTAIDVGNEEHFQYEQVPELHISKTAEEYIGFFCELYRILCARLPAETVAALPLGIIGLPPEHPLCVLKTWDREVLEALHDRVRYLDVHIGYSPYFTGAARSGQVYRALMASGMWVKSMLDTVKEEIRQTCGGKPIGVHITEMGPLTFSGYGNTVAGAVFQADLFNILLRDPQVTAANHLPFMNSPGAANVIGTANYPFVSKAQGTVLWKNPISHVFDLYTALCRQQVLETAVECGAFDSEQTGLMPAMKDVPAGDAGAYRDADGTLTLMLVNRDDAQTFFLTLPRDYRVESAHRLSTFDYAVDPKRPAELAREETPVAGRVLTVDCPSCSLTRVRLLPV